MKRLTLTVFLVLATSTAFAQETFPGLKAVLTPAEWKRAGLDRLSPDELGVIDAALIRHQVRATAPLRTELAAARETAATAPAPAAERSRGWMERFGLPLFDDSDWRTTPPLRATVVAWESSNRFRLDNGQVWEGFEPIRYELTGKAIEIQARPHGQFALSVEGLNTTIRVIRLR